MQPFRTIEVALKTLIDFMVDETDRNIVLPQKLCLLLNPVGVQSSYELLWIAGGCGCLIEHGFLPLMGAALEIREVCRGLGSPFRDGFSFRLFPGRWIGTQHGFRKHRFRVGGKLAAREVVPLAGDSFISQSRC